MTQGKGAGKGRTEAKGFYRLLSNPKFELSKLHQRAISSTIERLENQETVLLIQDTSDINLNTHTKTANLGYCSEHIRGIKLHSCIAVTTDGLPVGLIGQSYETRKESKSSETAYEKAKRPIEEKESNRWLEMMQQTTSMVPSAIKSITITDREGDFFELYTKFAELDEQYIIRIIHNRETSDGEKLIDKLKNTPACGTFAINVPRDTRACKPARRTEMEVAYCSAEILKPLIRKESYLPEMLNVGLVRITEITPDGEPIEWYLATNLQINGAEDCKKVVDYYVLRWSIERFHFVLKSGCGAEKIQQRTYEKILPVLLIYSVIALYIMQMTLIGRIVPDAPCDLFFSEIKWKALFCMGKKLISPQTNLIQ